MMGRAHRVLLGLGLALLLTLFLCDDDHIVAKPSREPEQESGGTRLKVNGEPFEVEASQLIRETLRGKQSSDITGHFWSSASKKFFAHPKQRRSLYLGKLVPVFRPQNPLREALPTTTSSTTTTTTTTTPEPTVVTVTEVLISDFNFEVSAKDSAGRGGGRVLISFEAPEKSIESSPLKSETSPKASKGALSAVSAFSLGVSILLALSRLFSG